MKVNIEILKDGIMPKKGNPTDAGFDCYVRGLSHSNGNITYNLGFKIEIPKDYVGLLFPRSSIKNYDLIMTNSVGVIDTFYGGEVSVTFKKIETNTHKFIPERLYELGERCCQLVILPIPSIDFQQVEKLSDENTRSGFGSTGC